MSLIGDGVLDTPYDLTVNCNNQLLIVDYAHNCVYIFTLEGDYIGKLGAQENGKNRLNHPCSVATDSSGRVLVMDTGNNCVVIFDADGNFCIPLDLGIVKVASFMIPIALLSALMAASMLVTTTIVGFKFIIIFDIQPV